MDLPFQVAIFGTTYTVKRQDGLKDSGCYGKCSLSEKLISIDSELEGEEFLCTLVHEIMHAALEESTLHYMVSDELNEALSDAIGIAISKNFIMHTRPIPQN